MPATFVSTAVWRAAPRIGLDAAVTAMAYVAGVIPAPARVAVGHCYVTYDRLERMHSRCVGHWTRVGLAASGSLSESPAECVSAQRDLSPRFCCHPVCRSIDPACRQRPSSGCAP